MGIFPCARLRKKQPASRKMPPLQQGIYPTKTKAVRLPFLCHGSHFTAMNFLATTDRLQQFKDGRKAEEIKFKPYSEAKPCQKGR